MAVLIEASDGGSYILPDAIPHDWTEGTGVFPAGGSISIPAATGGTRRKWLYIQNQDVYAVSVSVAAKTALGNACTAVITLAPAAITGGQGGSDERGKGSWAPNFAVTVTGTAGAQVCVLEVVE